MRKVKFKVWVCTDANYYAEITQVVEVDNDLTKDEIYAKFKE